MADIINVHIYDPSHSFFKTSANEKAEVHIYSCDYKDECDMFKLGKCHHVAVFLGSGCKYGHKNIEMGYTKRAQGYSGWIRQRKERYDGLLDVVRVAPHRISKMHGGYFLPYAHMAMNTAIPFEKHDAFFISGMPFLEEQHITAETLSSIYTFRPQAMMGGEIKIYQTEVIPKFLIDLKTRYPDILRMLISVHPEVSERLANINHVGRKALLNTIRSNVDVVYSKNVWHWDGIKLTTRKGYILFDPCGHVSCYHEYTPTTNAEVVITDNAQVVDDTVFVD
jgi:hypothetical protein